MGILAIRKGLISAARHWIIGQKDRHCLGRHIPGKTFPVLNEKRCIDRLISGIHDSVLNAQHGLNAGVTQFKQS